MITSCSKELSTLCKPYSLYAKIEVHYSIADGFESNAVQQCYPSVEDLDIKLHETSIADISTLAVSLGGVWVVNSYVGNLGPWLAEWSKNLSYIQLRNFRTNAEILSPSLKSSKLYAVYLHKIFSVNVNPGAFIETSNDEPYVNLDFWLRYVKVRGPRFFPVLVKPSTERGKFTFFYVPLYNPGVEESYPVFYPVKREGKNVKETRLEFSGNFGRRWPRKILERFSHIDKLVISASVEQIEFGSFGLEKFIASNFTFLEGDWNRHMESPLVSASCQESWKRGICSRLMEGTRC